MRIFKFVGKVTFDILQVIAEMLQDAAEVIVNNLYNVYKLIMFACPYLMLYLGVELYKQRGIFTIGGELFIPIAVWLLASLARRLANKNNRGDSIPVPRKRFTEIEEDVDGYTINQDDINEIILYLGEVEDYLEKKRLL